MFDRELHEPTLKKACLGLQEIHCDILLYFKGPIIALMVHLLKKVASSYSTKLNVSNYERIENIFASKEIIFYRIGSWTLISVSVERWK